MFPQGLRLTLKQKPTGFSFDTMGLRQYKELEVDQYYHP